MIDVPASWLWIGLAAALVLTVAIGWGFTRVPLSGMVDFELAGTADEAGSLLAAWRQAGMLRRVRINLWIDMAWIPCYVAALAFGCLLSARAFSAGLAAFGIVVAIGQLLAGALDYGENVALLRALGQFERQPERLGEAAPRAAAWCARMKFRLITIGLVYIALGAVIGLL